LRINDRLKIQALGKRAKNGIIVLEKLYNLPIIKVKQVEKWTGLSRTQANELVKKMIDVGVLEQINKNVEYSREFCYKKYLDLFVK